MVTLRVGLGGFTSIQAAIDAANSGDTIQVSAGKYRESLTLNKSVQLVGSGAATLIQSGAGGNGIVLAAGSSGSTIAGFNFQGGRAGILTGAKVKDVKIRKNLFSRLERYAVQVANGSSNIQIERNTIESVNVGIQVLSDAAGVTDNITILRNKITNVTGTALYLTRQATGTTGAGGFGNVTLQSNKIFQQAQKLGANLSLITLEYEQNANHGTTLVSGNTLILQGAYTGISKGAYGLRVKGNVGDLNVTNNSFINRSSLSNLDVGGVWIDTQDDAFGKIPGTARFSILENRFQRLDAGVFYDGVLSSGTFFDDEGNEYTPVEGSDRNDIYTGTEEADIFFGGKGSDLIEGKDSNDQLYGEQDNDAIVGGLGTDKIDGGSGSDSLNGGLGRDRLTGGTGRDLFVFDVVGSGVDQITDFSVAQDVINLRNILDVSQFQAATAFSDFVQLSQRGADTLVRVDVDGAANGRNFQSLVRLDNVTASSLAPKNFTFTLTGTPGADQIVGGAENDALIGSAGSDVLTGGTGRDQFIYTDFDGGIDTVKDFDPQNDWVNLRELTKGVAFQSKNPFTSYVQLVQVGANTQVQVNAAGDRGTPNFTPIATLEGVNAGSLAAGQFVF
jgi:Ca2+-binding RTX toxin-like protein